MNGIIGLLEIGEKHAGERELIDANRQKAKVAANHLLALISDVLELSKMDDENVTLAHEPFDVRELADEILTITELRASEQGITVIHSDCSDNAVCPYVYGSPLHVKRVILNIFGNAIKYNKPNGSISCSMDMIPVDERTVSYQVTISDTGIGMSSEFLEHIFEPFSQERNDARSTYQGTGLRMAIVKSLLDKMNGTITVESKVGEDSTFIVAIPLEIASKEELSEQETGVSVDLSGSKVLLVEDNELNMEIAAVLLEDAGLEVTKAYNGRDAAEIFGESEEGAFHLILIDLMMPEMDGFETTRTIRGMDRADAKTIPIIAMTANVFDEDVQKCMDAGMNGHLAKPLDVEKLMNTLVSVLKL